MTMSPERAVSYCETVDVVPGKVECEGDTMQWQADTGSELVAFEVCFPPYQDGRHENL